MKKRLVLCIVTAMMLTMTGCGQEKDSLEDVVYEDSVSEGNETADDAAAQEEETDAAVQEGDAADTTEPTAEEAAAGEESK